MKPIVVLYHAKCWDGFGAAWAVWKKLKNKADYIPVEHQMPLPKGLTNKTIYMVDFCYPENIIKKIAKKNKKVVVIDHHAGRQQAASFASESVFDNKHSGSVLAWMYFHPKEKTPWLLRHVEDTDLWEFRWPHSKELMRAVDLMPYKFEIWDKVAREWERPSGIKKYITQGSAIMAYVNTMVKELADLADEVKFEGYKVMAVNGPRFLRSDLGNELVKRGSPFAVVWYMRGKEVRVALRSDGKVDTSKIAEKYGGGGHKNASGFSFKTKLSKDFPWKLIK